MEPGPLLLLLLLAAPWGRGRAASGHAPAGEMARTHGPSVQPGEPGKCLETSATAASPCGNICSSKCQGGAGCGQKCQQATEDSHPRTDPDLMTNCLNKCRHDSNDCKGSRKRCRTKCEFSCLQQVPAGSDTYLKKKVPHDIGRHSSTCSGDTDCPNRLRCCPPPRKGSRLSVFLRLLGWGCHRCPKPTEPCRLPPAHGPYRGRLVYRCIPASGSCQVFVHSGCGGNPGNFRTAEECQRFCQRGLEKH
ncbi:uncharacterized protein LOC110408323 [Numida meleagris]|uniref:uncharacterized protein LOC110408323 n=1 Tax=Numida meleagris TaxID=8996 RepID=UPI000B3DB265|nr:uncharacterized protein LOC110408323 [Numida meleagris]